MADLNIEQLQKTIDVLQEKLQELVDQRASAVTKQDTAELTKLIKNQRDLIREQNEKLKELKKTQDELDKTQKKYTDVITKSIDVVNDFRQAIASTEFSFNNFTKSATGLATGATEATGGLFALAAESLGANRAATAFKIGTAGASKAVGIFTEQLIKQADNLLQAFDSIASIGGAVGLTSIQIEEIGKNAGFSGEALKFFAKLTKEQGSNLIAFGGNVSDGTRAFSEFIDVGENQLKVYSRLGISQNQLAEYQAFYADNLLRSGTSIDRSSKGMESLRKSSLEYRDILIALSSVTGQTLEQQQRAMDLAAADELFVAKQSQLDLERRAILAEANNLEEGQRKEELLARAEEIQNRIEFNKILATRLSEEQVGTQKATAVREMIASDGLALTESSAVLEMLFSSLGKSARDLFQDFANAGSVEDFLRTVTTIESTLYSSVDTQLLRLGQSVTAFGDASREIQNVFGLDVKAMAEAAKRRGLTEEQINEEIFETLRLIQAERENAELSSVGSRQQGLQRDPVAEARAQAEAAGRALREKESEFYTNLIEKTFPAFTTALEGLTTTIRNASPGTVVGTTTGLAVAGGMLTGALALLGARSLVSVFKRPTPASPTPTTAPPVTPSGTTATPRTPPSGYTTSPGGILVPNQPASVRPAGAAATVANTSRWNTFMAFVAKKSPRLLTRLGPRLAAMAGMMTIPGPGWIAALISFGLNLTLAWELYNLWKEFSGSSDDTGEDNLNENSMPVTGMGGSTTELAQSLAVLTGTDTEIGTVPRLTNSFDSLINATNLLTMSFSNLSNLSSNRNTPSNTVGSMTEQQIKDYIIQNEGIRYDPYLDTEGNWTVGVGHNLGKQLSPEMNRTFTHQEVMELFEQDYREHRIAAERIPGFNSMDSSGQMALTDMTFNMGPSWIREWPELQNQLAMGDTTSAANNLRSSLYYNQVGSRGERNAQLLQSARPDFGTIDSNTYLTAVADNSSVNTQTSDVTTVSKLNEVLSINRTLMEMLNSKMDNMIGKLDESNYIQGRILSNTV